MLPLPTDRSLNKTFTRDATRRGPRELVGSLSTVAVMVVSWGGGGGYYSQLMCKSHVFTVIYTHGRKTQL